MKLHLHYRKVLAGLCCMILLLAGLISPIGSVRAETGTYIKEQTESVQNATQEETQLSKQSESQSITESSTESQSQSIGESDSQSESSSKMKAKGAHDKELTIEYVTYENDSKGNSQLKTVYETQTEVVKFEWKTLLVNSGCYADINSLVKEENLIDSSAWDILRIENSNGKTLSESEKQSYYMGWSDQTVRVVLSAKKDTILSGVSFFDYDVALYEGNKYNEAMDGKYVKRPDLSINTASNYDKDSTENNRLSAGTGKGQSWAQNYKENCYRALVEQDNSGKVMDANVYQNNNITKNIIAGLSDDYSKVIFNSSISEPGFFSSDSKIGKTILNNYKLQFDKDGYNYTFTQVKDEEGNAVSYGNAGDEFFPLDDYTQKWKKDDVNGYEARHNYYFGMRYDIDFSLNNYRGDLTYSFSGDDDLWVLLDGKVVLDIGGIHDEIPGTVDLWPYMMSDGQNIDDKKVHRLTVLYMERGANASNCTMKFVIPNAVISEKPVTPSEEDSVTYDYNLNKTATLTNWENRTYNIDLTASSESVYKKEAKAANIMLVLDASKSMDFPAGLCSTQKQCTYDVDRINSSIDNMKNVLNELYMNNPKDYYTILDPTGTATVVRFFKKNNDWYCTDASNSGENGAKRIDKSNSIIQSRLKDTTVLDIYEAETVMEDGKEVVKTRQDYLKSSCYSFIDSIAKVSPDSKIGIVTFNASADSLGWFDISSEQNVERLKNKIEQISLSSCTNQALGLSKALELYNSDDTSKDKFTYAVLMTDGAPNPGGNDTCTWSEDIEPAADNLKNAGVTLMTIGLSVNNVQCNDGNKVVNVSEKLADISSPQKDNSSAKYAYTTEDASELGSVFASILGGITKELDITGAVIRDVLDSRFELTDNAIAAINKEGGTIGINDEGLTYIEWNNQTISIGTDSQPGWHKTIEIKAKDEYIGGNSIPTNAAGSGITAEKGGDKDFPQPKVNVNIDLKLQDIREVIFKGENAKGLDEVISDILVNNYSVGRDGGSISKEDFSIQWYRNSDNRDDNAVKLSNDVAAVELSKEEIANIDTSKEGIYYVKLSYNKAGEAENNEYYIDPDNHKADGTALNIDNIRHYAAYTIRVVSGELDLSKLIDKQYTDIRKIKSCETFIYKIEQYSVEKGTDGADVPGELKATFYQTLSFDANGDIDKKSAVIKNLEKGFYTVTEESPWTPEYELYSVSDNYENNNSGIEVKNTVNNVNEGYNLYIGSKIKSADENNGIPEYYGIDLSTAKEVKEGTVSYIAAGTPAEVDYENHFNKSWKSVSDVAVAVNRFVQ